MSKIDVSGNELWAEISHLRKEVARLEYDLEMVMAERDSLEYQIAACSAQIHGEHRRVHEE
jgi:hypothetical protein